MRKVSILWSYDPYLPEHWRLGAHNRLKLWRESVAPGYPNPRVRRRRNVRALCFV